MNANDGPVTPTNFRYSQTVLFNGDEYFVADMCYERRQNEWYHKIKRRLPIGRCTDGTGIETRIVAESQLKAVVH